MSFVEKRLQKDVDLEQPWILNKQITKSEPRLILTDTAAGGAERRFASSGGHAKIKDSTDADVMDLEAHAGRHASGGADPIGSNALRIAQIGLVLGAGSSVSVAAAGTYTLPKGVHYVFLGANTRVELYDDVAAA